MENFKYINRYQDEFTFERVDKGILWKGNFEWCRYGWPNRYELAYEKYISDGNSEMEMKDFESQIFTNENLYKYQKHVYSDQTVISMIDPSGGPYLTSGMKIKSIIPTETEEKIKEFKRMDEGYLIILD
jgi:hypothetical protein